MEASKSTESVGKSFSAQVALHSSKYCKVHNTAFTHTSSMCLSQGSGHARAYQMCALPTLLLVLLGRCNLPFVLGELLG